MCESTLYPYLNPRSRGRCATDHALLAEAATLAPNRTHPEEKRVSKTTIRSKNNLASRTGPAGRVHEPPEAEQYCFSRGWHENNSTAQSAKSACWRGNRGAARAPSDPPCGAAPDRTMRASYEYLHASTRCVRRSAGALYCVCRSWSSRRLLHIGLRRARGRQHC